MQMKRYMMALMIAAVAAGTAFAEEGNDEQESHGGKAWSHGNGGGQGWERGDRDRGNGGGQDRRGQMDKRGGKDRPGGPMSPEEMEQMKADHKVIQELGEAARAETDPAKKAEIVAQLRTKLADVGARMLANQEKRLVQAEERLAGLKEKIEYTKANRETLLDEQVQRILAGERPMHPGQFKDFPNAKGGMSKGGPDFGGMPPPPMGDDMPPPPPGDEDMPPPAE
jgi:hypothetical protein